MGSLIWCDFPLVKVFAYLKRYLCHYWLLAPYDQIATRLDSALRPSGSLDFQKAGIILHALAAVADNPSMVHDDAGVTRSRFFPAGFDDDVAGRGFTHGDLREPFVMQQGIPKD